MTSVQKETKKRVYISLPKKYIDELAKAYELDHGLVITDLNPYLNEGYIEAYFREWGSIISCKVRKKKKTFMAFVRFSSEDEADRADWAGPHFIGGTEVKVKRFVSPAVRTTFIFFCLSPVLVKALKMETFNLQIEIVMSVKCKCAISLTDGGGSRREGHPSLEKNSAAALNGPGLHPRRCSVVGRRVKKLTDLNIFLLLLHMVHYCSERL
uniref:RRM domain-containing protein n=1 Tax=Salarias fasciatus TaxID=181472 RepID=A0A672GN97_SALFA